MRDQQDFSEDDAILAQLTDPLDREAFSNIMEHAHARGQSAASVIQEEPEITSRKSIRKLCLKDKKKVLSVRVKDVLRKLGRGMPRPREVDKERMPWDPRNRG